MGGKLVPKIILEGTRLTYKTEIAFGLHEHPEVTGARKYKYHSPIISAEWCSFTNYPWGRGLINFLPEEYDKAMETYATWIKMFELQRYYSWIIDRFHISTKVFQAKSHAIHIDFSWLEERLAALNFRLVVCTRTPDSFIAAREQRLLVSGNPSQYNNIDIFINEQNAILEALQHSKLTHYCVDVSHNNPVLAVDEIVNWLKSSGGLYLHE
ncbi:MAG: hypothetical protein HYV28_21270 [Ignavibacteriales bacterium]|nr:hypothetical protein [Ignavibacteriales bacterium]